MQKSKIKTNARLKRHKRIRSRIFGTAARPRLYVFRSNRFFELQLIDDEKGHTLAAVRVPLHQSFDAGIMIAAKAKEQRITKIIFDRGGYAYHGHVKKAAEGARSEGLIL